MRKSLLLLAVAVLACCGTASATTQLVMNPNDSGTGSLRDAILFANADASATPADPDTILLSPDITVDVAPTTAWPTLANHITMIGPESLTVAIRGSKTFRVFTVAAGFTVRLINVRAISANTTDVGAGILNAGDLTMINCNVRNCTTGKNGGAIQNTGRLTLIDCWLDKNKVNRGGGLSTGGGGLSNDEPGTATLINCTLSNDVCSKGGYGGAIRSASSGGVFLTNCTIVTGDSREPTPGGGGIATLGAGVTKIDNTIVIGSVTGGDLFGPVNSDLGHNVIGSTAGGTLLGNTDGNISGVLMSSVLEPTLEHNGTFGRTHALIPGSPGLDAGANDVTGAPLALATDARGLPRDVNGGVDIGAFEEQQPLGTSVVTNGSFESSLQGWEQYDGATVALGGGGMAGNGAVHVVGTGNSIEEFGLNDTPYWLKSTVAGQRYRFSAFVRSNASHGTAWLQLREYNHDVRQQGVNSPAIELTSDWQLVTAELTALNTGSKVDFQVVDSPQVPFENFDVDAVSIRPVLGPDTPPRMFAPPSATAYVGLPLAIDVRAADADGDTLSLLAADVSGLPSASTFTTSLDFHTGRFLWTPLPADTTGSPFPVVFSAENVRTGHVITTIRVLPAPPNLVANPGFELATTGWGRYGSAALSLSPDAHSGTSALLVTGPASSASSFGCVDVSNSVALVDGAGSRYRFLAWVKAASGGGRVKLRVREFNAGSQVGETHYSAEVPLTASWQLLSVDDVPQRAGSSLEFRVTEAPAVAGSGFLVDDVVIVQTGAGAGPVTALGHQPANGSPPDLLAPTDGAEASAWRVVTATTGSLAGFRTFAVEGLSREQEASLPTAVLLIGSRQVAASAEFTRLGDDVDGNGIEEVAFSFPEASLAGEGAGAQLEIAPGTPHAVRIPVELGRGPAALAFSAHVSQSPIRSEGTLVFTTTKPEPVRVMLFDTSGRRVETLDDESNAEPGRHTLALGGRDAALRSGIYFYRITAGEGVLDGHFALIR
jgi:hypothetical protein